MHYNCLIVDDETDLAKMTCEYFELFDVSCIWTASARDCESLLWEHEIDLLLLDINLQEESGFSLCKKIRESFDLPVLFISARQSDEDILIGLHIGGDDYVKKPYTLSVLLAKVQVMLKRMGGAQEMKGLPGNQKEKMGIYLDEGTRSAFLEGREISLKARKFKLFQCLLANRNTIVTKEELFNKVWGDGYYSDGTLNVHIRRLREKLEENPNEPKLIKTIWGTGYMLEIR